jgi:antitoxin component of RelBE/YafQ-DinJ toxin-antitoxin module
MRKKSTTIRITEEGRNILASLAAKLGISQAAVMELALRKLAKEEGLNGN